MAESDRVSQASAVPYRFTESGLEFCLITTRKSRRWGFPKGRIRNHETSNDAALNEAHEEAGLSGRIVGEPLGQYSYQKEGLKRHVIVMLMAVSNCADEWKESGERERRWASLHEAQRLLDRPFLIQMLQNAFERIQSNETSRTQTNSLSRGRPMASAPKR